MTTTTSNMSLVLPDVGITTGTQWASLLNAAYQLIDAHDHSSGKGVKITPSGMNISADLSFGSNNATTLRTVRMNNQSSFTPTASDLACIYVLNNEIYYRDGVGNSVQITSGGSLNTAGFSLSSLSIRDTSFTLQYFADTSKQARFDLSLVSTGTTVTYTMPQVTSTIASGTNTLQLTNKDIDGGTASNTSRITLPKNTKTLLDGLTRKQGTIVFAQDQNKAYVDNGTSLVPVGSGSTGLYTPIDFEDLTTGGISTYANAAGALPVTGTGGSPVSTFVNSASTPLRGTYEGLFTKGAANRQGEGFSLPITLSAVDTAKTIQVSFDLRTSAAFTSGDMVFYVYDVTNAALITPSQPILPTGTSSQYSVAFNATTSTSYRLIWHVATTSASAYTVEIDQISISPIIRPIVAGIGDWIAYTPTISAGFGTVTNNVAYYKRVGDRMEVSGSFTTGTVAASLGTITLPSTFTLDTTKLNIPSNTTSASGTAVGSFAQNGSVSSAGNMVTAPGTSTSLVYLGGAYTNSLMLVPTNVTVSIASTNIFTYNFSVPIAQWSSNLTLTSSAPAIEYQYNSSGITTAGASDTSSYAQGAVGAAIGAINNSTVTGNSVTTMQVQFSTPIQATDRIQVEIQDGTTGVWIPAYERNLTGLNQGAATYGITLNTVSTTKVNVLFGNGGANPNNATFALTGTAWPTTYRWRVAKYSSIGAVELAPATELTQGTVGYSQWTSYTPTIGSGAGTATSISAKYRREGDSMRIKFTFTTGTVAASLVTMTLPSTYTIDSTKIVISNTSANGGEVIGTYASNGLANSEGAVVSATGTSTTLIYFGGLSSGTAILTPANGSTVMANTSLVSGTFLIPISGWN